MDAATVRAARAQTIRALPEEMARFEPLRQRYLDVIERTGVGYADNIRSPYAWSVYVHYTGLLERLLPDRRATIVDWGGLYGHVTALLRARGFERAQNYLLHEPQAYAEFERAFDLPTVWGKDPNVLAIPDASADCIISSGVLEHVREDGVGREEAVLVDVRRALKPGGILAVWHLPTLLAAADIVAKLRGRWYHRYRYTARDVRRLVADAGLELVRIERHGGAPPSALLRLAGGPPARWMAWDLRWGSVPGARLTAQNFAFIAEKGGPGGLPPGVAAARSREDPSVSQR